MALSQSQRDDISRNVSTLKHMSGIGICKKDLQTLTNQEFMIFVGLGGTGITALCNLRKEMYSQVQPQEIKNKVRFLAIDTDSKNNLEHLLNTNKLDQDDVVCLKSNRNVHETINPKNGASWATNGRWANPDLYKSTSESAEYAGIGAGAMRQVGRSHLMYSENFEMLQIKLVNITNELTVGTPNPNVKIFVFSGIAGGTGSGTLIDFGIILRHVVNEQNPNLNISRADYRAFVLMPSAVGGTSNISNADRISGERNAYALLKEMDYLNTIGDQNYKYVQTYGYNESVVVDNKVYDFVSLIEGKSFTTALEPGTAVNILVKTIMSMIVANDFETKDNSGQQVFLLDSLLSNTDKVKSAVGGQPVKYFPRNANYAYNSLGYAECEIPVDLIISYVMKHVFDEFYEMYADASVFQKLTQEKKIDRFDMFLEQAELTEKDTSVPLSYDAVKARADKGIRWMMTKEKMGPWYVCSFTYWLLSDEPGNGYLKEVIKNYTPGIIDIGNKNECRQKNYQSLFKYMQEVNSSVFEIYSAVVNEIRSIIEDDAGIITATDKYNTVYGQRFAWTPINMSDLNPHHEMIKDIIGDRYLQKTKEFAKDLSMDLWDNRDMWTDVTSLNNVNDTSDSGAAKAIREFVAREVGAEVKKDIELLLVIAYSGNRDAELEDGVGNNTVDVKTAANQLYNDLKQNAMPLAGYTDNQYASISSIKYIAVPANWTHISIELKALAQNDNIQIYHTGGNSNSSDYKISSFQVNHGLAPFMLGSIVNSMQKSYEVNAYKLGVHLVQGTDGNWAELQNLDVMDRWNIKLDSDNNWVEHDGTPVDFNDHPEVSKRECEIISSLYKKIDYLKANGMFSYDSNKGEFPYSASVIIKKPDASDIVAEVRGITDVLNLNPDTEYSIEGIISDDDMRKSLEESGYIKDERVEYSNMEMTESGVAQGSDEDKERKWYFSKQIMRRNIRLKHLIEYTYDVICMLNEYLDNHNQKAREKSAGNERIVTLVRLIARGYITYDEDYSSWMTCIPKRADKYVVDLSDALAIKKEHNLFAVYKWFIALDDDEVDDMRIVCLPKITELEGDELAAEKEYKKREDEYKSELKAKLKPMMENDRRQEIWKYSIMSAKFEDAASKAGMDAEEVRDFYNLIYAQL